LFEKFANFVEQRAVNLGVYCAALGNDVNSSSPRGVSQLNQRPTGSQRRTQYEPGDEQSRSGKSNAYDIRR
jgi:hypothetical protein